MGLLSALCNPLWQFVLPWCSSYANCIKDNMKARKGNAKQLNVNLFQS